MNTATVGAKTGTATIALTSDGTGTSGLGTTTLTSQTVNIQGQVNFLASAKFVPVSGSGTLSQNNATTFTIDFGQVTQNTGTRNASLGAQNLQQDPTFQDTLGGTFSASTVPNFTLSGFSPFSSIASGSSLAIGVGFNTAMATGIYSDFVLLNPTSTNANGTTGVTSIRLNFIGEIIPVPEAASISLLTLGGGLMLGRRRRKLSA